MLEWYFCASAYAGLAKTGRRSSVLTLHVPSRTWCADGCAAAPSADSTNAVIRVTAKQRGRCCCALPLPGHAAGVMEQAHRHSPQALPPLWPSRAPNRCSLTRSGS